MNANVHSKQPVSRVALQQHGSQVMVIVAAQRGGGGGQNFSCQLFIKLRLSNGTSNDVRLLRFAFG